MTSEGDASQRQATPTGQPLPPSISSLTQKRIFEDDHSPAISSPLNPDQKSGGKASIQTQPVEESSAMAREKRAKKDSFKKREAKGSAAADSPRATLDPKQKPKKKKNPEQEELAPIRYKLARPKPTDFEPAHGPVFTSHHEVTDSEGRTVEFFETSEHVYNKKNYHYTHCIADPAFPSLFFYRQTEPEPFGAHMSFEDAAAHMFFDKSGSHVTTNKGFRMNRANVGVRAGRWYWECKVTQGTLKYRGPDDPEAHGHVRMGWARREASLDAPVGYDAYSYGIRDVAGEKVHMSRPLKFFPQGEGIREGDVVGMEIQLPSEHLHRKVVQGQYNPAVDLLDEDGARDKEAPNIVRDRIPIRFKSHIYFEKIEYHSTKELEDLMNPSPMNSSGPVGPTEAPNPNHKIPALRTLPNSYIKVYKNGVLMGTAFTDLLAFLPPASNPIPQAGAREGLDDGALGYYPAVSVFRGGAAEVNFGPRFWYPPPGYHNPGDDVDMIDADNSNEWDKLRAASERYDEQIAEDIVYDIVDEVSFWMQDGGKVIDRSTNGKIGGLVPGGREEIKELVQDD